MSARRKLFEYNKYIIMNENLWISADTSQLPDSETQQIVRESIFVTSCKFHPKPPTRHHLDHRTLRISNNLPRKILTKLHGTYIRDHLYRSARCRDGPARRKKTVNITFL